MNAREDGSRAGVEVLLRGVARLAGLGSRFGSEAARAEARGIAGTLNLELADDGGGWHLEFRDGALRIAPGLAEGARTTVRVRGRDLLALAAGDATVASSRLTGKVRVSGDGNLGMMFDALIGSLQNAQKAPGVRGWIARRFVARALRKGGYVPRAARSTGGRAGGEKGEKR